MITIAMLLAMQAAPADAAPPVSFLPAVQAAVKAALKDPDSAKFEWPYGFVFGVYKEMLGRQHPGMITCGTVNAKNGYGGYTGAYAAVGVVNGGEVTYLDIDEPGTFSAHTGWVADQCRKLGMPVL